MTNPSRMRLHPPYALILIACLSLCAGPVQASLEVAGTRIRVIPPDEVLRDHTEARGGRLVFRDAEGSILPLITDPAEVPNPGDGVFHPAEPQEIVSALESLPGAFLRGISADIFVLPYPREGLLSSSAASRAIYITPGVLEYAPEQIHFLVAHEVGHLVHRNWLPDSDTSGWASWARIRGVEGDSRVQAGAAHAWRPREIFAEDFRVLFGGRLARGDGSVENPEMVPPSEVPGLREFYLGLVVGVDLAARSEWQAGPNPVRSGATLTLRAPEGGVGAAGMPVVELFDVAGRRMVELMPEASEDGVYRFPSFGRDLAAGAYWLRVQSPESSPSTVALRLYR